jgi:hypothetical protein
MLVLGKHDIDKPMIPGMLQKQNNVKVQGRFVLPQKLLPPFPNSMIIASNFVTQLGYEITWEKCHLQRILV